MVSFKALVRRHCRIYYMDKATVIASLLMPLILIFLYLTILKNVYVSSFADLLPEGCVLPDRMTNGFIFGWLFAGLLAATGVTVSFCSNIIMTQDRLSGLVRDLAVSPVGKVKLGMSYYFANLFTTFFICLCELVFALIILACMGWYLTPADVLRILLIVFINANFGTALSSFVFLFVTSNGQLAAINTIVSAGYGFFCGAFMPIAGFGGAVQKAVSYFPGTYITYFLRDSFLNGVLRAMETQQLPEATVREVAAGFDLNLFFSGSQVTAAGSFIAAVACVAAMILIYAAGTKLSKKAGRYV